MLRSARRRFIVSVRKFLTRNAGKNLMRNVGKYLMKPAWMFPMKNAGTNLENRAGMNPSKCAPRFPGRNALRNLKSIVLNTQRNIARMSRSKWLEDIVVKAKARKKSSGRNCSERNERRMERKVVVVDTMGVTIVGTVLATIVVMVYSR